MNGSGCRHAATLNTDAELVYDTCLGPDATCTWMNDLDRIEALAFIEKATVVDKLPFFLYLSTTTPHEGNLDGSGPKPGFYAAGYPVPHPYNQRFLNESAKAWTNQQRQFASAVWAQVRLALREQPDKACVAVNLGSSAHRPLIVCSPARAMHPHGGVRADKPA